MNTKLKNEFKGILEFDNPADKADHDSKILMFKFLSIIEEEMKAKQMSKKDLASLLDTSPSYITQLFRGTKTINLIKIAQLQAIFNIEFTIGIAEKTAVIKRNKKRSKKADKKITFVG